MNVIFDLTILGLMAGMTYALFSEGLWGAALMFFNVLFSALISFNFYEPLAALIVQNVEFLAGWADMLCMLLLFVVPLVGLKLTTDSLAPGLVRFPSALDIIGKLVFAFGGSAVTIAMILLAFQAAPVQKKVFAIMGWDYSPVYKERFDRDFLAFFQYTSGYTFARNGVGDPDKEFKDNRPMLFDPRGEWLMLHMAQRPYGTETVLPDEGAAAASTTTPSTTTGQPGAPGAPGAGRDGPGIPGGNVGAAAGLAPTNP